MADNNIVHVGENSPEQVAYKLLELIMQAEKMVTHHSLANGNKTADRDYILNTYAEALRAVRSPSNRPT